MGTTITINVTEECIARGRQHPEHCAICCALRDALNIPGEQAFRFDLPPNALAWHVRFIAGEEMAPFSFEFDRNSLNVL